LLKHLLYCFHSPDRILPGHGRILPGHHHDPRHTLRKAGSTAETGTGLGTWSRKENPGSTEVRAIVSLPGSRQIRNRGCLCYQFSRRLPMCGAWRTAQVYSAPAVKHWHEAVVRCLNGASGPGSGSGSGSLAVMMRFQVPIACLA
jgi:hypothetical protein